MSIKSVMGKLNSRYDIGDTVTLKSGIQGNVIGMAEYRWDWAYRIKIPNRKRTIYREERQLKGG